MAALDALVGLASYTAEQVTAMSLEKRGVSIPKLWERKIKTLQNNGIEVYKPGPNDTTLDELKGLDNVINYAKKLIKSKAFNLIVFIDEMDKSMAGGMRSTLGTAASARTKFSRFSPT